MYHFFLQPCGSAGIRPHAQGPYPAQFGLFFGPRASKFRRAVGDAVGLFAPKPWPTRLGRLGGRGIENLRFTLWQGGNRNCGNLMRVFPFHFWRGKSNPHTPTDKDAKTQYTHSHSRHPGPKGRGLYLCRSCRFCALILKRVAHSYPHVPARRYEHRRCLVGPIFCRAQSIRPLAFRQQRSGGEETGGLSRFYFIPPQQCAQVRDENALLGRNEMGVSGAGSRMRSLSP